MITTQSLAPPRPDCPVCSPVYAKLFVQEGFGEATLQELVDLLRGKIGYDEFAITTEVGIIYDPDLEDNLGEPLRKYVAQSNGFITVTDESDEPRVDLVLSTITRSNHDAGLQLVPDSIALPSKPKQSPAPESNSHTDWPEPVTASTADSTSAKRKREAEDEFESAKKRAKAGKQDVHVVDDDGAIVLDDD